MASLCNRNPVLRPPTPINAKIPLSSGAILGTSFLMLRMPLPVLTAKTSFRTPKAIPSQKYVYPDPIPEFATAEARKFKAELLKKLSREKGIFGDELQTVVNVCAEIFSEFLHEDYGGPGTLLIEPCTDMMVALKEKNLPGAALAARVSLLWAQKYIDQDWEDWNSKSHE